MLSCHLPGGSQIGRMSLPKFLPYVKRETFLFWCSVSFWNILQGPFDLPAGRLFMFWVFFPLLMRVACFFFRYLLWDLRAKRKVGNCRGCSLEFPACCRVGRRACPGHHPPRRARPLQPAPSCLRWPMCVRACVGWMSGKASDTAEGGDEQQA